MSSATLSFLLFFFLLTDCSNTADADADVAAGHYHLTMTHTLSYIDKGSHYHTLSSTLYSFLHSHQLYTFSTQRSSDTSKQGLVVVVVVVMYSRQGI